MEFLLSSLLSLNFFSLSPHLRRLSTMTKRAEMLPSGSGPFPMVAGAGVGPGGRRGKYIQSLAPYVPVLTASAVAILGPEICGRRLPQCPQCLQPAACCPAWGMGGWCEHKGVPLLSRFAPETQDTGNPSSSLSFQTHLSFVGSRTPTHTSEPSPLVFFTRMLPGLPN